MKHFLFSIIMLLSAYGMAAGQNSELLGSGRWVKVSIDTTGIYQLTFEQLKQMGFAHPERVGVYGYGAIMAADNSLSAVPHQVCAAPSLINGQKLVFYGEGPLRATLKNPTVSTYDNRTDIMVDVNTYSSTAIYYLSDALPRKDLAKVSAQGSETLHWHHCIELIEHEVQNPAEGGAVFHGPLLNAGDSETFSFPIADFAANVSTVGTIHLNAATKSSHRFLFSVKTSGVTNNTLSKIETTIANSKTRAYTAANGSGTFSPADGKSTAQFTITIPSDFDGTYAAVDRCYIVYPRRNTLSGRSEMFINIESNPGKNLTISDASADATVWDVTQPENVIELEATHRGSTMTVAAGAGNAGNAARLVAFVPSAQHRTPKLLGEVKSAGITAEAVPELLIVTTSGLRTSAEQLADIHRRLQDKKVLVVDQNDVFTEFSYGMRSAPAIRRMVSMFAQRAPGTLRHLLLYGPSSFDNRGLEVKGEFLVCYECQTLEQARDKSTNYASDAYFGILQDVATEKLSMAKGTVAVGRIPATDEGKASKVNKKIERYLSEPHIAPYRQRILKFSDDGDGASHFSNSETFVNTMTSAIPGLTVTRADNLLFPWDSSGMAREALRRIEQGIVRGQGMVFYSGHGDATSVCKEINFNVNFADKLTNNTLPLFVFSTCDNYPFDRDAVNLSQAVVLNGEGGGIGSIGACRTVYLDYNHKLAMAIADEYSKLGEGQSGADILMNARNALIDKKMQPGASYNTMCYNFCGDPAVPLLGTCGNIVPDILPDILPIGSPFEVSGSVDDKKFKGTALIEFYDVPKTATTLLRNKDDGKERSVKLDQMLLAQFYAKVENGKFRTEVILPPNNAAKGTGRMVVTAVDSRTGARAAGELQGIVYADAPKLTESPDNGSAQIEEFYIDPSDYTDGNNVASNFRIHARIKPSSAGLAIATSTIDKVCSLLLDGHKSYADAVRSMYFDNEGNAVLQCRIGPVSDGHHTLTLTAVDNAAGSVTRSITFVVGPCANDGTLTVAEEPCRSRATFSLDNAEATQGRLIVTDIHGRTVFVRDNCTFPYSWSLLDNDGTRVSDGLYRAWVIFPSKKSTPLSTLTVIR